jgi:hypothetical protein
MMETDEDPFKGRDFIPIKVIHEYTTNKQPAAEQAQQAQPHHHQKERSPSSAGQEKVGAGDEGREDRGVREPTPERPPRRKNSIPVKVHREAEPVPSPTQQRTSPQLVRKASSPPRETSIPIKVVHEVRDLSIQFNYSLI